MPPFFVVAADAFREHIESNHESRKLLRDLTGVVSATEEASQLAASLQSTIRHTTLTDQQAQEIRDAYRQIVTDSGLVAVRSSASDEDGADHSFAGMHDSFMFVPDFDSVVDSIRNVWASAFNQRAIAYRLENGLDVGKIAVAVVVQQMIDACSSGVIFTCNPASSCTSELVISSVWGAGEGLVSGGLAADTMVVKKKYLSCESTVVEKNQQLLFDSSQKSGLIESEVPKNLQKQCSLSDAQIEQAAQAAIRVEQFYRRPQDIEFCFDQQGNLFILQSRPVTRIRRIRPGCR